METREHDAAGGRITAGRLREWREEGVVDQDELAALEEGLIRSLPWELWATRLLAGLAALLMLCGVVFFFAYNWHRLPAVQKFLVVGAGWGACMAGAVGFDARRWVGELFLLGAAVFTGVFLAVFGQVYQTGADSYQLFLAWGLFVLPLALWGRSGALWLLWLAVVNIALGFAWEQVLFPDWQHVSQLFTAIGALDALALMLVEGGRRTGLAWFSQTWLRIVVLLAAGGFLTVAVCLFIVDTPHHSVSGGGWTPVLYGSTLVAGFLYYRLRAHSLPSLAILVLSACTTAIVGLGRIVLNGGPDPVGVFLLLGVATLGIFLAGVGSLKIMARHMREEGNS